MVPPTFVPWPAVAVASSVEPEYALMLPLVREFAIDRTAPGSAETL